MSYQYTLAADSGDDNDDNDDATNAPTTDLEGGGGGNSSSYSVVDVVEPVPNLDVTNGNHNDDEDETHTTSMFASLFSTRKPPTHETDKSGNKNNPPSTRVAMLQFMYRQYVASQANEHPQAVWALGKMFLVMVYFINLMEQPLDYLTGASSETAKNQERKKRKIEQQQQQQAYNNHGGRIRKGYIRTRLGVVHYRIVKPVPPQPTNTTTSSTPAASREGRTVRFSKSQRITSTTEIMLRGHREPVPRRTSVSSISSTRTTPHQQQQPPSKTTAEETTPIVCFHAAHRSSEEFTQVLPLLSTTNQRRVALAIDILGYGQSDNPTTANNNNSNTKHYFSLDDLATCLLREVIDTLLVPVSRRSGGEKTYPPFIALGSTDLGCYLITSILCRFPQRIHVGMFVNIHHPNELVRIKQGRENDNNDNQEASRVSSSSEHELSLQELRVLQSTLANRLLEQERKEVWHVKLQDLNTYDLGRDARRPIACPLLFVQWQQQPPQKERAAAVSSSIKDIDDAQDSSGPEENNNNNNNRKATTSSSYNNRAIRLFTEGGGSNTPIGITDMCVVNDENTSGGGHPTRSNTDMDLLHEHAPEFVAVCEEFIQTMTT